MIIVPGVSERGCKMKFAHSIARMFIFWFVLFVVCQGCGKSTDQGQEDWVSAYDFNDLNSVAALYGVSWGIQPSEIQSSPRVSSTYQAQSAANFFEGAGKDFYPPWKDSFESGEKTEMGWKKGLREFYMFTNSHSSECLVFQFYESRLNKIFHQFSDGSKLSLELLPEELPFSGHEHRNFADILGARGNGSLPDTNKSVTLNGFLLESLYKVTWDASPEMVHQSILASEWTKISPEEVGKLRWWENIFDMKEEGKEFPLIREALTLPKVESNATESGALSFYFFKSRERVNNDYMVLTFERERLRQISVVFLSGFQMRLLTITPPGRSSPVHRPLLTCAGVILALIILFTLILTISSKSRKRRREQELIERGRRSAQSPGNLARRDHFK